MKAGMALADHTELIQPLVDLYKAECAVAVKARGVAPTLAAIDYELQGLRMAGEGFDGRSPLASGTAARIQEIEATKAMLEEGQRLNPQRLLLIRLIIIFASMHGVDPGELSLGSKPSGGSPNKLMDFLARAFGMAGIGRHPDTIWKDARRFRRLWPHAVKGRDST